MDEDFEEKENLLIMLTRNKPIMLLTAVLAVTLTAAGCTKESKGKEHLEQALAKQAEMKTYSFAGSADLQIEPPAPQQGANPLTATFMNMFLKSKLEWSGVSSSDPVRFEADIKSTPAGSNTPLELPVLLKDNKLYLHIPMLNKDGEYYSMDMEELSKLSGKANPLTPDSLKNISKSMSEAAKVAITDVNPGYFQEKTGAALKDGSKAVSIRLDITDKNQADISKALQGKLPQLADTLKTSGLLSQSQADQWKTQGATVTVKAPGAIAVLVDEAGFIREQTTQLTMVYKGADGKEHTSSFQVNQIYNDVNQSPKFTKEEPKSARPLSEILKLIMPKTAGK